LQDLGYTFRQLRKNPGFTALALPVMALGIGANTAMFSIVNAVLLRPLRFRDADRIVTLSSLWRKNASHGQVSAPDFHDWHDQSTAFDAMAYYDSDDTSVGTAAGAEYHSLARVTPEFFRVFQLQPLLGRLFSEEEMRPGSSGAVVVSYAYWQSHFGGQPTAVGQTVGSLTRLLRSGCAAAELPLSQQDRPLVSSQHADAGDHFALRP
jgi:hypothetical protein